MCDRSLLFCQNQCNQACNPESDKHSEHKKDRNTCTKIILTMHNFEAIQFSSSDMEELLNLFYQRRT